MLALTNDGVYADIVRSFSNISAASENQMKYWGHIVIHPALAIPIGTVRGLNRQPHIAEPDYRT